ncbi:gag-pol polyprotein, partial [Tanacetum coccineum]
MWKAIEKVENKVKSIIVQDLKPIYNWEFGKFTSRDVNVQFLLQLQLEWQRSQQSTRNRGKAIVTSSAPTYDPEPATVTEDEEMSKEKEIDKLMALISLSFKKIYKPTNNNLRTSSNTSRANQDNSPRINRGTGYDNQRAVNVAGARENVGTSVVQKSGIQCYNCKEYGHVSRECQKPKRVKDAAYHKEKMLLCKQEEAGVQLNAEQADWKDDTDDESDDQELEAHYMYMAQLQEVTPDQVDNSGPIFDDEPMHKVQNNNDNYNVFAMENEHPEQPESSNDIYLAEHGDTNITIDSLDICYDRVQDDQDDTDDLDQERDLLASLIQKLKCEIDDSKNRNKFLESSNKELVDKLKGEIEDFKTKNKSLESSNNHFKEANNELSKTNQLMFKDLKKFQAELDKYNDVNYASKVEIDCAKAKGDLMSYKIDFKPKRVKDAAYHKEKMLLCKQEEAGVQLNAEQADWKDDTDDESDDQELEAHYMYMAQLQEVTPDPVDNSGPIFDDEPTHKVQNNNDNHNVFAMENEHSEQLEPSNDIYLTEQGDSNITIDSSDICYDSAQDDQDENDDLDQERDLLASLIQKLKCEIDDSKNRNKFLESSNKELVNKLKGEIEDFKTKNKSLESSNNHFKEANNELSKTNQLMFKDLKKFQAELDKYNDVNYASKVEIDCAKAKGDLMSYKIDFEKSSNAYTQQI